MSIGLLDRPALGPNPIRLRSYQEEAVEAVFNEWQRVKNTAIVMATGTGKSKVGGQVSRTIIEGGGTVLILCPTRHLVFQMANTLDEMGVEAGIEMAAIRARELYDPPAVVATVATLHAKRLQEWGQDHFSHIIIDECHHSTGKSCRRILKYFPRAKCLGMTATLDRADEEDLGQIFDSIAYEFNLWAAMTAPDPGPYLSRLTFVQCDVNIDLRDLRTKDGDFTDADLEARIGPMVETLANAIRQEAEGRSTLVFTPMIKSAQGMATALQSIGVRADWVSGDDVDRDEKLAKYQSGEIQMLCNVQLLTEGVDLPRTSAIALCRPTKSRPLYAQIVGRGTRLFYGKTDCRIIDFNYLTSKHQLVKPVELCDGIGVDQEVMDIAHDLMKKNKDMSLVDAVDEAKEEHRKRQVLRIKARERNIAYRRVSYDPLSICDAVGLPWRGSRSKDAVIQRATIGQVRALERFGVQDAPNLSKARASTMLDYLCARANQGLATPKQVSWLIANDVPPELARKMTKQEASEKLSQIWGKK